jgi:RNA polymerase sigma-70 factor, ECF subfamily
LRAGDFRTREHFAAYFGKLMQFKLRSRLHSPEDIKDAGQEIFARFYAALREGKIVHPERLGSFVNSICNNVLEDHYRASARSSSLKDDGSRAVPIISSEVMGAPQAEEGKIREILKQLSENDRRLLREVFLEGRDTDDVCREFNIDLEYIRVLLRRLKQEFTGSES